MLSEAEIRARQSDLARENLPILAEPKRFTTEVKEVFINEGYLIRELTDKTIGEVRDLGLPISPIPKILRGSGLRSSRSEIAYRPDNFLVSEENLVLPEALSKAGFTFALGLVQDYVELRLQAERDREALGYDTHPNLIKTKTRTPEGDVIAISFHSMGSGIGIYVLRSQEASGLKVGSLIYPL